MFTSVQAIYHDIATSVEESCQFLPKNKTNNINNNKTHVSSFIEYKVAHIIYILFKILLKTSRQF